MRLHRNARTCPASRRLLVDRVVGDGWLVVVAAEAAGISERTAAKWLRRYREEGAVGLEDRLSAARRVPHRTPSDRVDAIAALRRLRFTGAEISWMLGVPLSTVHVILKRLGLGRLSRLEPAEPANRYQRRWPGELVHIDIKKLARIDRAGHAITGIRRGQKRRKGAARIGYEYVHVCVDDATRLAYVEVLPNEQATTAIGFLHRLIAFYAARGVSINQVMTDNGSAYRSAIWALACRARGIGHLRTRPYRPRTNGKAERFIRTLLDGWAYAATHPTSTARTHTLPTWLDYSNHHRPHGSLAHKPPGHRPTTHQAEQRA